MGQVLTPESSSAAGGIGSLYLRGFSWVALARLVWALAYIFPAGGLEHFRSRGRHVFHQLPFIIPVGTTDSQRRNPPGVHDVLVDLAPVFPACQAFPESAQANPVGSLLDGLLVRFADAGCPISGLVEVANSFSVPTLYSISVAFSNHPVHIGGI